MFELKIKTGYAAFCDPSTGDKSAYDEGIEVARILREVADKVENESREGSCIDYNGNKVGEFKFS